MINKKNNRNKIINSKMNLKIKIINKITKNKISSNKIIFKIILTMKIVNLIILKKNKMIFKIVIIIKVKIAHQ